MLAGDKMSSRKTKPRPKKPQPITNCPFIVSNIKTELSRAIIVGRVNTTIVLIDNRTDCTELIAPVVAITRGYGRCNVVHRVIRAKLSDDVGGIYKSAVNTLSPECIPHNAAMVYVVVECETDDIVAYETTGVLSEKMTSVLQLGDFGLIYNYGRQGYECKVWKRIPSFSRYFSPHSTKSIEG